MSLREEQSAFAEDLVKLLQWASSKGLQYTVGEVFRPIEMQKIYMQQGRSTTLNSMHLKKCAADVHFFVDGHLCYPMEAGKFWESLNEKNKAGMFWKSFKDAPHFERTV